MIAPNLYSGTIHDRPARGNIFELQIYVPNTPAQGLNLEKRKCTRKTHPRPHLLPGITGLCTVSSGIIPKKLKNEDRGIAPNIAISDEFAIARFPGKYVYIYISPPSTPARRLKTLKKR